MGRALQVFSNNQVAVGTNSGTPIFGGDVAATEANTTASWRQAGTFTRLGRRNLGGNGTNTTRLRVGGGNGNNVLSAAGTGWLEDTSNSDTIVANTTVAILNTDTGTSPTYGCWKILFTASGDHCAYHGAAGTAVVYDVASSTRFLSFSGLPLADGAAAEATTQLRVRSGTALRSFQVRVTANARLNTSDFRSRKNGANGNCLVQFATLVTGLVIDDANSDTLASGDLVNASITLGAGVEDLTVSICGCAQTNSSAPESDLTLYTNSSRTASATPNYLPLGGNTALTTETTEADVNLQPGFPGRIRNLRANVSANTYTGACTIRVFKNGAAALTLSIAAGATGFQENSTDTLDFLPTDTLSYEIVGGTANSITILGIMVTVLDLVTGTAAQTLPRLRQAGVGVETFTGTAAQTLPKLRQSGTGVETFTGTAAQTLPSIDQQASGSHTESSGSTGTGAQTLPSIEQSGAGVERFTGTGAQELPSIGQSATGILQPSGTGAQELPSIVQSATGAERIQATSAQTLPSVEQSATGRMQPSGTAAQILPSVEQSASGSQQQPVSGTAAQTLPSITQSATGSSGALIVDAPRASRLVGQKDRRTAGADKQRRAFLEIDATERADRAHFDVLSNIVAGVDVIEPTDGAFLDVVLIAPAEFDASELGDLCEATALCESWAAYDLAVVQLP